MQQDRLDNRAYLVIHIFTVDETAKRFSSATNYAKGIRGNLSRGMPCAWLGVR